MMRTAILKTTSIGNVAAPRVEVTGVLYNLGPRKVTVKEEGEEKWWSKPLRRGGRRSWSEVNTSNEAKM